MPCSRVPNVRPLLVKGLRGFQFRVRGLGFLEFRVSGLGV